MPQRNISQGRTYEKGQAFVGQGTAGEMSEAFFAQVERVENLKLNKHMRNHGATELRLREGEGPIIAAIWKRTTGIPLPAALTVKSAGYEAQSMIVTRLELHSCSWSFDWHIVLCGHNLRQTGAAGSTREYIHLPLRLPISMSQRDLTGQWRPVVVPQKKEASC